jgi:hypothetical protein
MVLPSPLAMGFLMRLVISELKENRMNPMRAIAFLALSLLISGYTFADDNNAKLGDRKVSVVGFVDAGQIVKGSLIVDDGATAPTKLNTTFLNRNGIALSFSGVTENNLRMNIGVGGLFWKPMPENTSVESKRIQFGPGISEASVQYDFSTSLNLKFGFFGYKYNSDAMNLGEYLLRSEAYPTIIHTAGPGGWVWMNSNEYKSMGTKLTWDLWDGKVRQDILLFSEFNEVPIFDFSPSYVATIKIGKNVEVGGGFSLHRWLPIKPSVTTSNGPKNTYVEVDGFPEIPALFDSIKVNDSIEVHRIQNAQPAGTLKDLENNVASYKLSDKITSIATVDEDAQGRTIWIVGDALSPDTLYPRVSKPLSFKAIKVMAKASLNLGGLLDLEEEQSGPFKVFAELAILGVENQPYFYEKIQDRIPVMVGIHLPTFGILNLLSCQLEYFKNPFPENSYEQYQNSLPQPALPNGNRIQYEFNRDAGLYKKDDLKWTVYLQKALYPGLDLYVQAANDHFRIQNEQASLSFVSITREKSDWYYLVRFQWSM